MLAEAPDPIISEFANRLRDRRVYSAVDIRERLRAELGEKDVGETAARLDKISAELQVKIEEWNDDNDPETPRILIDVYKRSPYKELDQSKGPINQIMIRNSSGELVDLGKQSPAVAAIEPFRLFRAYVAPDDDKAMKFIDQLINTGSNMHV